MTTATLNTERLKSKIERVREKLEEDLAEWGFRYPSYDSSITALGDSLLNIPFREIALEGTGLSTLVNSPTGLQGQIQGPLVLEIVHLTDIGTSAFALEEVRQQRQQVELQLQQSRIRAMVIDEVFPSDLPLPQYPRNVLKLFLSDGFMELEAVECERLRGLALGRTSMGTKLRLTNFSIVDGVARLYSANVEILGGKVESAERQHSVRFFQELKDRMEAEYFQAQQGRA